MIGTAIADSETTIEELTLDLIFLLKLESIEPGSGHWQIMAQKLSPLASRKKTRSPFREQADNRTT
jgi:hypothetical protein